MSYQLKMWFEAETDLVESARWYENRQPGQGIKFLRAIRAAIVTILANPTRHRIRYRHTKARWFIPRRFPYKIIFRVDGDTVNVIAVVHGARHDRVWMARI